MSDQFINPTRAATGEPTDFKLSVRLCHGYKDGRPNYVGVGTPYPTISVPRGQADKWARQGLGQIVCETQPVEVRARRQ